MIYWAVICEPQKHTNSYTHGVNFVYFLFEFCHFLWRLQAILTRHCWFPVHICVIGDYLVAFWRVSVNIMGPSCWQLHCVSLWEDSVWPFLIFWYILTPRQWTLQYLSEKQISVRNNGSETFLKYFFTTIYYHLVIWGIFYGILNQLIKI